MDQTANLSLAYIMPQQAQKYVTHNDALRDLNSIVQLAVLDRDLATPPGSPAAGDRYIVAASPTGAWSGHAGAVASYQDGAWLFYVPQTGWRVWIEDEAVLAAWTGSSWALAGGGSVNPVPMVGVLATATTTDRLSVKSDAVLFANDDITPGSGDMRFAVSKASAGKDGSVAFQDGLSTRALLGLLGDDNFSLKASPDGSTFYQALSVDKSTGHVGVGTTADGTNTLSVAGSAALLSNASGSFRVSLSKSAAAQTASYLFQDAFSGRAEFGLTGDDHFHLKVSPDGSSWSEAIYVNGSSAKVGIGTSAPTSRLTATDNTGTLPSPPAGTVGHFGGVDGSPCRVVIDSFGSGVSPNMTFRHAGGTAASPSAIQTGDQLLNVASFGYGATGYSSSTRSGFIAVAAENWSDTAQGCYFTIATTPTGSAASAERLRINGDGSLLVGAGTQTIFNAAGIAVLKSYTTSGLPSASTAGQLVYVSNGASNKRLAVSDGSIWRYPDGSAV